MDSNSKQPSSKTPPYYYVNIPRQLRDDLESGKITVTMFMCLFWLHSWADWRTGVAKWVSSSMIAGTLWPTGGVRPDTIRKTLKTLEACGYIKSGYRQGSRENYPVTICNFHTQNESGEAVLLTQSETIGYKDVVLNSAGETAGETASDSAGETTGETAGTSSETVKQERSKHFSSVEQKGSSLKNNNWDVKEILQLKNVQVPQVDPEDASAASGVAYSDTPPLAFPPPRVNFTHPLPAQPSRPGALGFKPYPDSEKQAVRIMSITPKSPLELADVEPDDFIVAINDKPVTSTRACEEIMAGLNAGDTVTLRVQRGTKFFNKSVTLWAKAGAIPIENPSAGEPDQLKAA